MMQVITPFRSLVLCADSRREMEEWIAALKAAASKEFYDVINPCITFCTNNNNKKSIKMIANSTKT